MATYSITTTPQTVASASTSRQLFVNNGQADIVLDLGGGRIEVLNPGGPGGVGASAVFVATASVSASTRADTSSLDVSTLPADSGLAGSGTVALDDLDPSVTGTYGPISQAFPSIRSSSGHAALVNIPNPTGLTAVITDPDSTHLTAAGDGPKFFSLIRATGRVSSPLDTYYGYVGGHDSDGIWLLTAPAPEGPWTWRSKVMSNALSGGLLAGGECTTPDVIWWGGRLLMYFHGKAVSNGYEFPTCVAQSTDGVTWTSPQVAIQPQHHANILSYYGTGADYMRVTDAGGYLLGIFQTNHLGKNSQVENYATAAVGWATSVDGLNWRVAKQPLLLNEPGKRGLFAPYAFRTPQGMWGLIGYAPASGALSNPGNTELWVAPELKPGMFRRVGVMQSANNPPYTWLDMPHMYFDDDGVCHYFVGYTDGSYTVPAQIRHCVLDWRS